MSNILTYPGIPIVAGGDVMIISDVSGKGNPTRTVSVDQLGAYIGAAGGGGAGVASINTLAGAIDLVGGTNVTLATIGNTITINATGTVTSVAATFGGNAFALTGSPITGAGTLAIAPSGAATQYINGLGNLVLLSTIPTSVTLTTTGTSGAATLTNNVLNIPNYGGAYTSYVQLLSQNATDAPAGPILENTAGLTAITWSRTSSGKYVGTFGASAPADIDKTTIMIHTAYKSTGSTLIAAIQGITDTTSFALNIFDTSGAFFDSQLLRSTLEIRIYP